MRGMRTAAGSVALLAVLGVTACTAEPPDPAPAPPAPAPSVSQSPTETPQERQERLDYAAAEKAYRTFRAEYNRVLRAGGAKKPTKIMKATAGGEYLDELMDVARAAEGLGDRQAGVERIVYVRPTGHASTEISLEVCEDSTETAIIAKDGKKLGSGDVLKASLLTKRIGKTWKVWSGQGQKVSSCD